MRLRRALPWLLTGLLTSGQALGGPSTLAEEPKPLTLQVGVVDDSDFPPLDEETIKKALQRASATFNDKFGARPISFQVTSRMKIDAFMRKYVDVTDPDCSTFFAARYQGNGRNEIVIRKDEALRFLERWPLETLVTFAPEDTRARIKSYDDLFEYYASHYAMSVARLEGLKTPKGAALVDASGNTRRSYVAWACALRRQPDLDVVITNTFILADLLTEPHPHAALGKAKIGGIAGPNKARKALGGQALLASTFGIDTNIGALSELNGTPATPAERANLLGTYLLAHEIAHAVYGIPDFFDHPESCLMTSRPGETYLQGLAELDTHPGPCPKCRPWVHAKNLLDKAKDQLSRGELKDALALLTTTSTSTPKLLHGGYKRRMSEISLLVAKAYAGLGRPSRARSFAKSSTELDPSNVDASTFLEDLDRGLELASTDRRITTTTSTKSPGG